jgi:hypothetical protein
MNHANPNVFFWAFLQVVLSGKNASFSMNIQESKSGEKSTAKRDHTWKNVIPMANLWNLNVEQRPVVLFFFNCSLWPRLI